MTAARPARTPVSRVLGTRCSSSSLAGEALSGRRSARCRSTPGGGGDGQRPRVVAGGRVVVARRARGGRPYTGWAVVRVESTARSRPAGAPPSQRRWVPSRRVQPVSWPAARLPPSVSASTGDRPRPPAPRRWCNAACSGGRRGDALRGVRVSVPSEANGYDGRGCERRRVGGVVGLVQLEEGGARAAVAPIPDRPGLVHLVPGRAEREGDRAVGRVGAGQGDAGGGRAAGGAGGASEGGVGRGSARRSPRPARPGRRSAWW